MLTMGVSSRTSLPRIALTHEAHQPHDSTPPPFSRLVDRSIKGFVMAIDRDNNAERAARIDRMIEDARTKSARQVVTKIKRHARAAQRQAKASLKESNRRRKN